MAWSNLENFTDSSHQKKILNDQKKFKFKLTWFRVFFIYGANLSRTILTNILLKSKKLNNIIILNKKIKRDYVDINFVADVFIKNLENDKDYGIVNLASGKKTSLRDLVKLLSLKYKIGPKVKYEDTRQRAYEPESFYGCNKKLKKIMRIN